MRVIIRNAPASPVTWYSDKRGYVEPPRLTDYEAAHAAGVAEFAAWVNDPHAAVLDTDEWTALAGLLS